MDRKYVRDGIVLVTLIFCLYACSDREVPGEPVLPNQSSSFEGIWECDESFNSVGGDTTDFQPLPLPRYSNYSLHRVCPNPVSGNPIKVVWQMPQPDSVWILVYDQPGELPVDTIVTLNGKEGIYLKNWTVDYPAGIYRIVMFTGSGFSSYGDIRFE
jgi:hypothetical protein